MSTEQLLVERYGPLLTLLQVAELLDRSPEGLRITIRGSNALGRQLSQARVKIGRRVHFKVGEIAALVDGSVPVAVE
jgi:hypothetical protein